MLPDPAEERILRTARLSDELDVYYRRERYVHAAETRYIVGIVFISFGVLLLMLVPATVSLVWTVILVWIGLTKTRQGRAVANEQKLTPVEQARKDAIEAEIQGLVW